MNKCKQLTAALTLGMALMAAVTSANAAVITFGTDSVDRLDLAGAQTEDGFEYSTNTSGWEITSARGNAPAALVTFFNDEGSTLGDTLDIAKSDGGLFLFDSVDFRGQDGADSEQVRLIGILDMIEIFTIDLIATNDLFQNRLGAIVDSGMAGNIDLLRLEVLSNVGQTMILDNFTFSDVNAQPVNAPTSLFLLASGMVLLLNIKRKL